MNIVQKLVIIIPALLIAFLCKSQNIKFGGTLNMGASKVNFISYIGYKDKYRFSGNVGIFVEKQIKNNLYLGIEALWVQIEGKNAEKNIYYETIGGYDGESVKYGEITEERSLHISYFALPLYVHYEFGKLGIKVGFQTMFCLFTSTYFKSYGEEHNVPFASEGTIESVNLRSIDYGPKIGLDYKLNEKFRLRADYYKGRNNNTRDSYAPQGQNNQLNLGITYEFGIKNKTEQN